MREVYWQMKTFPAIMAALFVTLLVGAVMLMIGANALVNPNTVPVNSAPSSAVQGAQDSNVSAVSGPADQAQFQQMQNLIKQYQQREQQYKTQLDKAAQTINQDNAQLQNYQQLIDALQQNGIIRITQDGQILLPRRGFGGDD